MKTKMNSSLQQLQNTADMQAVVETLIKWTENSSNEDLLAFRDCSVRMVVYIQTLENEIARTKALRGDLRDSKNEAILRARTAEETIQEQAEEINNLKQQLKLFV